MKNKSIALIEVFSPLLLVLGTLGLFFESFVTSGYIVLAIGCVLGLLASSLKQRIDIYERFHLLACILGLISLGLFFFTGVIYNLIVALIVLFVIDFLIIIMDLRKQPEKKVPKEKESVKYNEKKILAELDNIKDELSHIEIYESGNPEDIEDLSARAQAKELREELEKAIVLQDPKEGRFFYKEDGKMFHTKGCSAIARVNKKELKSSNSRTELLAKGYRSCKICSA